MREHEAVLLLTDDPVALVDVPALAAANGWALEMHEEPACARFELRRTTGAAASA